MFSYLSLKQTLKFNQRFAELMDMVHVHIELTKSLNKVLSCVFFFMFPWFFFQGVAFKVAVFNIHILVYHYNLVSKNS